MKTKLDERFLREAEAHRFRYTCDDCVRFSGECSHGYPTAPHRLPLLNGEIVFCKEHELG